MNKMKKGNHLLKFYHIMSGAWGGHPLFILNKYNEVDLMIFAAWVVSLGFVACMFYLSFRGFDDEGK